MTARAFKASSLFFLLTSVTALVVGCSGKKIDESNPSDLYKDAEEDVSDKRYAMALDKLKTIKNKFPYSSVSTQAKLRIADVYYLEDSFPEAAAAYESFRDLHPKHEKADYVLFRIGESYFNQLPGGYDRDLTPAGKAIENYRELIKLYPKSQHYAEAESHLKESLETLAGREKYIGDFYYSWDHFDSAAGRYEKLVKEFSGSQFEEYGYWRWGQSMIKQGKRDEARHVLRLYLNRFPSGKYAKSSGDWLEEESESKVN